MREQVEPELAFRVKLDLNVEVADHVSVGLCRTAVPPVSHVASDYYPVVEELGGYRDVEHVGAAGDTLISDAHVKRDVEFLEYRVELVGHEFRHVREQDVGAVDHSGLLVR